MALSPDLLKDLLPDPYILVLGGAGLLIALVAWLPLALRRLPLSLPIVCIGLGAGFFALPQVGLAPLPVQHPEVAERLTELVVIIALMGAGLKIDRVVGWRRWGITWRLLAVTMPLSIAAIAILGVWAGLPLAAAILLAASLAPTDPVLAADVQVGPPREGQEDEVRFGLTSEAGLNDGLAFPFVNLGIALSLAAASGKPWLVDWLSYDVAWKLLAGCLAGWLIGRLFGWLTFKVPGNSLAKTGDGLIAIACTLVAYGATEAIHGYGFLAVFIAALTLRHAHRRHEFQREMHDITEQLERIVMMVVLLLFGGALVSGLLAPLTWTDVALALAVLLLVRPLAGLAGMIGMKASWSERLTLAFFGIRGVGSFYYLAYGLNHAPMAGAERLWAIVGLIVLLSVLLHGLTVTPVMRGLDRRQGRDPDAEDDEASEEPEADSDRAAAKPA
ncbi:sodium:proton antiporter [Caulobacter sp. SLTY]|uniref:cation:proton antiporter n=1 Tax=Caulobacter sp. SLTY TaxID=2683262 RepID=UPI00141228F8|nr:cation:proton antiporter [Caulobacter sp. SLTY]NBB13816.1 sodium:proton antiporter [Caulobacter sp. SLTY]